MAFWPSFRHQPTSAWASWLDVIQMLVVSLGLVLLVRTFLIHPFKVHGASMEPTFVEEDYLIVDEISFRFREPKRGEIIVFRYPNNPRQSFIKRVIGLPGETVEVSEGKVSVFTQSSPNGLVLTEGYIDDDLTQGQRKVTLKENEYFVLGDNRDESFDSRGFGPITADHIVGRVWFRGLPISAISTFAPPSYSL